MCSCHKQSGALVFWSGSAEEKNREWGADGLHFLCITHDDEHCLFKFEEGIDGSDSFIFKPCLEKSTLKTVFFLQAFPLALLTLLVSQLALAAAILGLLGGIFYTVAAALLLAVSIGSEQGQQEFGRSGGRWLLFHPKALQVPPLWWQRSNVGSDEVVVIFSRLAAPPYLQWYARMREAAGGLSE